MPDANRGPRPQQSGALCMYTINIRINVFFVHIGGAMVLDTSTMFRAGDIQVHKLFLGEPSWLEAKKSRDTDTAMPCVGLMFSSCWLRQSHLFSYWSGLKGSFDLYQPAYWFRQSQLYFYWSGLKSWCDLYRPLRQSHLSSYWSGLKSSYDLYRPGAWQPCSRPGHHACLDRFAFIIAILSEEFKALNWRD